MELIKFLIEYIKSPKYIGALMPSSEWLCEKMLSEIDYKKADCIVEYGSGMGVFTEKLVEMKKDDTKLFLFESNREFYKHLIEKYHKCKNIIIINDSAEKVDQYLGKYNVRMVDYVVSGLPFMSLPEDVSKKVLSKTKRILKRNGTFITFQYTLCKEDFIKKYFDNIELDRVILNVPPAYVFRCKKNTY